MRGGGGGGQFDPLYGFFKTVFSETFNIIIRHKTHLSRKFY